MSEAHGSVRVLVVDDDRRILFTMQDFLRSRFEVRTCETAEAAELELETFRPDVLVTDVRMPGESGLALTSLARRVIPECAVIVLTAVSTVGVAVEAMKAGAHDFLTKPVDLEVLELVLDRAIEQRRVAFEVKRLRERSYERASCALGQSPAMRALVRTATDVAASGASVLLTGESGAGKEVIARYIHGQSRRAEGPFVAFNCAAIPETLLEAELFGYEAGAFTGASRQSLGRFERAQGGTLLMDEVGELPLGVQVKLLRALQERRIERLGAQGSVDLDVRILAATNRDLLKAIEDGHFRADLYYRLNVIHLHVPPLRERLADIGDLWDRFVKRRADEEGIPLPRTTQAALDALYAHAWPGNVRELENAATRAVVMSHGAPIEVGHLPSSVLGGAECTLSALRIPGASMAEIERAAILRTLAAVDGSTVRCAEILGISVRKIQYRLQAWRREAEPTPGHHRDA